MSVAEERVARSVALEKAYVHDVYEQFSDGPRGRPWPKVNQFIADLEPGSLVCDVGCGNGKYLASNPSVFNIGADKCIRLTKVAREKENEVLVCDNLALPFRDESFDAVLSVAVVHHFATTERRVCALRELARILRIGGRLIISVWAMEQTHRKFESQDVLVPWHRPQTLSTPSLELTSTTNTSEEDVLPPYHAYTQTSDSDSNKSIKTKVGLRKRGRTRHKGRSIDPGRSSSPSSSSLSSPNETCYSFVRRAIQKLAGGKRSGTSHRPWFMDTWNSCTKEPPQKRYDPDGCENYDCGNVQDLPIELRRVDDEEPPQRRQTFPSSHITLANDLYGGIKSKSLTDIKTFEDRWIVRSQSSVPSLQQEVSQEEENPPPVEVKIMSNRSLNKPRLVKQKQSICEEDAEEALDKPTDMKNLVNALPEFRVYNGTNRHRGSVFKQRSMNEELMSTERLREKERVKQNIQKQASLNEDLIYHRHTLDTLRDSFFSVSTSKRFQLIKSGFTNTIKNSTTNIEKVAGSSLKNGFVRMFQGWKGNEFVVSPTQPDEVPIETTTNTTIVKPVVNSGTGSEEKKDISVPGERRHSREDGSDSSKDSSLQSDTSVDSEDSFASVIFVPKTDPLSPTPLSPGPTSPRLKQTSVPNSPRMKQSSCPTSPRIKQMPLTVYPLTKQLSSPKPTTNTPTTPTTITNNNNNNINNKPNNTTPTTATTNSIPNKPSTETKLTCARDQLDSEEKTDRQITNEPRVTDTKITTSPTNNTTKTSPTTTTNNNNSNPTVTIVTSPVKMKSSDVRNEKPSKKCIKSETLAQKYSVVRIPKFKKPSTVDGPIAKVLTESEKESKAEDKKRTERLKQIRELLNQRPGFGIRSSRSAFPIVRHSSTRSGGRIEAIARPLPRLLSLELFNPETDDKDSDSSGVSSPDSVDSVINIEVSENGQGTKSEDEVPVQRKTSPTKFAFPPVEPQSTTEVETLPRPEEDKSKLSPTSMSLLEAAADVANSLDEAVDAVIQSSPRAKRRQLQPVEPKEVLSVMERQYNTDCDSKCPEDCPSDTAVIESTWDEECHKHLTDFADKLSEKLLLEIDQYQEQTSKQEQKEVKFDVPSTFQHIDDPYIHRLSEELKDLNKLSAEIQKQNQYLSQLSKIDQVLTKPNEQSECPRCYSKLCKCSERIHSDNSDKIQSDKVPYYVTNFNKDNTVVIAETNNKCNSEIVVEQGSKDKDCLVNRLVTETTTTSDAPAEGNVVRNGYHRLSRESSDASTRGSYVLGAQHSVESNDMADISEMTTASCGSDSQKETNSLSRYSNGGSTASLGSCTEWSRSTSKAKEGRLSDTRRSVSQDKQSDDSSLNERMLAGNYGSLNASLSDTSQDSLPSDNIGGAITYHRYYHVFREGELDQLIERYVENLHIISSYYDHASWCVVAEKVQVWTI